MTTVLIVTVVIFLLFCPLHIVLKYSNDDLSVYVKLWYLFKINIYKNGKWIGQNKGKSTIKNQSSENKKEIKKKTGEESKSVSEKLEKIRVIFHMVLRSLNEFCKSFKMYKCKMHILVAGEDPANVAIEFGLVNAGAYSIFSLLEEKIKIRNKQIAIDFDYQQATSIFNLDFRFSVIILKFLIVLLCINFNDIIKLTDNK